MNKEGVVAFNVSETERELCRAPRHDADKTGVELVALIAARHRGCRCCPRRVVAILPLDCPLHVRPRSQPRPRLTWRGMAGSRQARAVLVWERTADLGVF